MAIAEIELEWGLGPKGFDELPPDKAAYALAYRNRKVRAHNARVDEIKRKRKQAELERKAGRR